VLLAALGIVAASSLVSILLVYPEAHYVTPVFPLALALAARGWSATLAAVAARPAPPWGARLRRWWAIAAAVLMLAVIPGQATARPWWRVVRERGPALPTPHVSTLRGLGRLPIDMSRTVGVIGYWGLGGLLGWNSRVVDFVGCRPFVSCVAAGGAADVIVPDSGIVAHYRRTGDPTFAQFAEEPGRWGFVERPVAGAEARIYVRADRLAAASGAP
jgi:hypothetical protein